MLKADETHRLHRVLGKYVAIDFNAQAVALRYRDDTFALDDGLLGEMVPEGILSLLELEERWHWTKTRRLVG